LSPFVLAQGGATGAINGTVQDASGAVLAGARVDVVSEGTGQVVRQLTTDSSGVFVVPFLPVGTYSVEVSAAGFARTKFPGILVRITETTRMSSTLKPSAAQELVEVQGEVATVNTTFNKS
jgi:Carboxypeptidase regulatory-like domain